jgi:hypothetical protein
MAEGYDIGSVFATIEVDYIDVGMKKAQEDIKKIDLNFRQLGTQMFRFGAILTAFGGGTLLLMKKMAETASVALMDTRFAEAMNSFEEASLSLQVQLGEALIPTLSDMLGTVRNLITYIQTNVPAPILGAAINFIAWAAAISLVVGSTTVLFGGVIKLVGGLLWLEATLAAGTFAGWISGLMGMYAAIKSFDIAVFFGTMFAKVGVLFSWLTATAIPSLVTGIKTTLGGALTWLAANPIILVIAALVALMYALEETGHAQIIYTGIIIAHNKMLIGLASVVLGVAAAYIQLESAFRSITGQKPVSSETWNWLANTERKINDLSFETTKLQNQFDSMMSGETQKKGGFLHDLLEQMKSGIGTVSSTLGGALGTTSTEKPKTISDFIAAGAYLPSDYMAGKSYGTTVNIDMSNSIVTDSSLEALQRILAEQTAQSIKNQTAYS